MAKRVDLFCEDAAHESWARAVIGRLAIEESIEVSIRVATARFGIPRLKRELRAFERVVRASSGLPDLLVILIDANDAGPAVRRSEVENAIDLGSFPAPVVGVPNPCVERWFLADPQSFASRFGAVQSVPDGSPCDDWKDALVAALEDAGEIVTADGAEFAEEIVEVMSLYRAGRAERGLKAFTDELRVTLRYEPPERTVSP